MLGVIRFFWSYEHVLGVKGKKMKAHEDGMCYWQNFYILLKVFGIFGKKLKANSGVRCYSNIFS